MRLKLGHITTQDKICIAIYIEPHICFLLVGDQVWVYFHKLVL